MKSLLWVLAAGCGSHATGYEIAIANTVEAPRVAPGGSISLVVKQTFSDGSTRPVPAAQVTWTGAPLVTAASADGRDDDHYPSPGAEPTAVFIDNPGRPDRGNDLVGVLFVLDAGTQSQPTIQVHAQIVGGGTASGVVSIEPAPVGDPKNGAVLYGPNGANCARCHGPTGHGSDVDANGQTYTYDLHTYDFPAPGLNAEEGNCAQDPGWNAALFAIAAATDVDNGGVTLRSPMPDYLVSTNDQHPAVLAAQDFADIFAFLQTQMQ